MTVTNFPFPFQNKVFLILSILIRLSIFNALILFRYYANKEKDVTLNIFNIFESFRKAITLAFKK